MSMEDQPERASRSRAYPLLAAVLALGAPLGYLLLRALVEQRWPDAGWVLDEVAENPPLYAYLGLGTLAVFASLGWALGRKEDELRRRSTTDPLTGLPNRRELKARLELELGRARRYGSTLSVLVLDVAKFKYPPAWVGLADLMAAMRSVDPDSRKSRGLVIVEKPKTR